jgi:hypothetical protein
MKPTFLSTLGLMALATALPMSKTEPEVSTNHRSSKAPHYQRLICHQAQNLATGRPADTIQLSKPSTEITWGRRDVVLEPSKDTIELGKPSTEITWGRRDIVLEPSKDTIELGKPSTEIIWGRRGTETGKPGDTIELGKPSTEIVWGKE